MKADLSSPTRQALLRQARAAVRSAAEGRPPPAPVATLAGRADLRDHHGCFVTLKTKDGALRGCIGTFQSSGTLAEAVAQMAQQAAQSDPRFPPVQPDEVDALSISLSLLTPRQPCPEPGLIELGRHGVEVRRGLARGVFLPQVATEQGWDVDRLLRELCRKAHLPADALDAPDTRLFTFEAVVFGENDG